jgi:ABC-type Fe3+-hydroxamate transport system substrate-binding protein
MCKNILFPCILLICLLTSISAQPFNRIVSLAPSLTKSLYYLESENKLVGYTSFCEVERVDEKSIVASAIQVNIEKLVGLNPDLVIATSITNPETLALIKKMGIRTEVYTDPGSFEEICNQFIRLGQLVGKEQSAILIVEQSKSKVRSLSRTNSQDNQPDIFFQIGAKPLFTVIPNTFMNDYILFAGGRNIAFDLKNGLITRESILTRNPDVIFIVTMGILGEEEKSIWKSYTFLNASKNDKIFIIDSDLASVPTPVTFVSTLERVIELLYKED